DIRTGDRSDRGGRCGGQSHARMAGQSCRTGRGAADGLGDTTSPDRNPPGGRIVQHCEMKSNVAIAGMRALIFGTLLSGSSFAQRSDVLGHWEGAIHQPSGDLRIVVDLSGQGTPVGGIFSMAAVGAYQWPLSVTDDAGRVRFRLPTGLLFEGDLQGETITGKVPSPTGGHTDAFSLKRGPAPPVPYSED